MAFFGINRRLISSRFSARRFFLFLVFIPAITAEAGSPAAAAALHVRTGSLGSVRLVGDLPHHNGPTLLCGDCHATHSSRSHEFDGAPSGISHNPGKTLLKGKGINELCLSCHDDKAGVPDVMAGDANGLSDRSAGFFQGIGTQSWQGHSLAAGVRQGSACDQCHATGKAQLLCTDCHDPHGNGRPRNLRWASSPGDEPQFGLMVNPGAQGMAKYESDNVSYSTTNDDAMREVSNICIDCHHGFSGDEAVGGFGGSGHIRHPSYDSERNSPNTIADGALGGTSSSSHWATGSGIGFEIGRLRFLTIGARDYASARSVNPSTNGVFCLSCHKAHGSRHAFGMTWSMDGRGSSAGCNQCHAK